MRFQFICVVILCLCINYVSAESVYEKLLTLKRNGIVTLSDSQYQEYILQGNRDFDAFILYSVLSSRYHCSTCNTMNKELNIVVNTFEKMEDTPRVLFIRLLHENSPRVFKYHSFEGIPNFVYIPSTLHIGKTIPPDNIMSQNIEGSIRAEHLTSFIRSKIAFNVPITRFPWVQVIIGCIFVFGLPVAAYLYLFKAEHIYYYFGHKLYYIIICLLVYALSVSGIIYDIIKQPPFMYCTQEGCSIFSQNGQGQYILEGMITGLLNLSCAFIILYLIKFAAAPEDKTGDNITTCVFGFGVLFLVYTFCYVVKNPWYLSVFRPRGN